MRVDDFQFSFEVSKQPNEVFNHLINPKNWWVGLFGEVIKGKSNKIGDEFTFEAGDGIHFSNQQLIQLDPGKKIVWLVTKSNLSFLQHPNEWAGTKICFDIISENGKTRISFSHIGLVPAIECYDQCTSAWNQYLENLKKFYKG